jgi:SAM-dependent methyltransferase
MSGANRDFAPFMGVDKLRIESLLSQINLGLADRNGQIEDRRKHPIRISERATSLSGPTVTSLSGVYSDHSRNGRYGTLGAGHSGFMLANLITFAHFSVSSAISLPRQLVGRDALCSRSRLARELTRTLTQTAKLTLRPLQTGGYCGRGICDQTLGGTMALQFRRLLIASILAIIPGLIAVTGALTQAQPSQEAIWKQFLEWLPSAPAVDDPGVMFGMYRDVLIKKGASPQQAEQELDLVRRTYRTRSDGWRIMFNNIYRTDKPGFSIEPNALLMSTVDGRKPGRALDIGVGQGRNSVFLALKGWDVTGFDVSDEGIATTRRNAERAGVKINAVLASEESFDYGTERWDLIVFMYEPFPIATATYADRLRNSLKPGGIVVIESFGEDEAVANRPATAIDPAQLLAAFKDFRLLHYQDVMAQPDWFPKPRRVVRMVAERR